jgi:hypothetical protein
LNGKKYYKLSNFDPSVGVVGHECINELIVDRLLTILGIDHLSYDLINADIEIDGKIYNTYLCASADFKERGESKIALDDFYRLESTPDESPYDFCLRQGFGETIHQMLAIDYIILNRDRHGANIEVLRNSREHTIRIAPLFDHGLSLLYSCTTEKQASSFDILEDLKCQNFIGTRSPYENLSLIPDKKAVFNGTLRKTDKKILLGGLDNALPKVFLERIWEMIYTRYKNFENL